MRRLEKNEVIWVWVNDVASNVNTEVAMEGVYRVILIW